MTSRRYRAYNVKLTVFRDGCGEITGFDEGLRRQLYCNYDYGHVLRQIQDNCKSNKVYLIQDAFWLHYIMLRIPEQNSGNEECVVIGPYIEEKEQVDAVQVANNMGLELYQVQVLKDYYNGTVATMNLHQIVYAMVKILFSETEWMLEKTGINLHESNRNLQLNIQSEDKLTMEIVEKRYFYERKLQEAIAKGDISEAEQAMNKLGKYRIEARSNSELREAKNSLIILNVMCRKAVEEAGVHTRITLINCPLLLQSVLKSHGGCWISRV